MREKKQEEVLLEEIPLAETPLAETPSVETQLEECYLKKKEDAARQSGKKLLSVKSAESFFLSWLRLLL